MASDPCAGLTGAELRHCLLLQYASGCDTQRAAISLAQQKDLLSVEEHNLMIRYVENGEKMYRLLLGKGAA